MPTRHSRRLPFMQCNIIAVTILKMVCEEIKALIFRYYMSYWNNRSICSAIGGVPSMFKRDAYYRKLRTRRRKALVKAFVASMRQTSITIVFYPRPSRDKRFYFRFAKISSDKYAPLTTRGRCWTEFTETDVLR